MPKILYSRNRNMPATCFGDLPYKDILPLIGEYTGDWHLSYTNRDARFNLENFNRGRHFVLTQSNVCKVFKSISGMNLQYTSFAIPRFDCRMRLQLPAICAAGVTTLKIVGNDCPGLTVDNISVAASTLGASPFLKSLHFEIFMYEVNGDIGSVLRLGLSSSTTLETLRIGVTTHEGCPLALTGGLIGLATLGLPTLRTLRLDFGGLKIDSSALQQSLLSLANNTVLSTLHLDLSHGILTGTDMLPFVNLRNIPNLHSLHLILSENNIGDVGAQTLAGFKLSSNLRVLTLDLTKSNISTVGVVSLCEVNSIYHSLRSLTLKLGGNFPIGIDGLRALATLYDSSGLETLHVDVPHVPIGDDGAMVLLRLRPNLALRELRFDLRYSGITEGSAFVNLPIHTFLDVVMLHTVDIDLSRNRIGRGVCRALSTLSGLCCMRTLHLNLSSTKCELNYLASLWEAPALLSLHLNMDNTPNGRIDAGALSGLRNPLSGLRELVLTLKHSKINDSGIEVLVDALRSAPKLSTLDLQLSDNEIGDNGAVALEMLKTSLSLTSLILNLEGNKINDHGGRILAGLAVMKWPLLRIDVRCNPIKEDTIDSAWRGIVLDGTWKVRRPPFNEWGQPKSHYVQHFTSSGASGRRLLWSGDGWEDTASWGGPSSDDDQNSDGEEPEIGQYRSSVFDGSICHPQKGYSTEWWGITTRADHQHACVGSSPWIE
jgi:hypothetical protein